MPSLNVILSAILAVVLTGIGSGYLGYHQGLERGELNISAQRDGKTVTKLQGLIESQADLVDQANQASIQIRETIRLRGQQDKKITRGLQDALAQQQDMVQEQQTLAADFRYSADVMRQLQASHQRASQAATGGLNRTVSGTQ